MSRNRAPKKNRHSRPDKRDRKPPRGNSRQRPQNQNLPLTPQTGTIEKTKKGFGFIIFDNPKYEDLFVPPREADRFFHGDRLKVTTHRNGELAKVEVLGHRTQEIVGMWNGTHVVFESRKNSFEVKPKLPIRAPLGDWVRIKLEYPSQPFGELKGEVIEIFGKDLPASADLRWISTEFGVSPEHSKEAVAQAEEEKRNFEKELQNSKRTDLRHIPFMTIDGADARDFDDAIYVERQKDRFVLWVAIADVSHYVSENSALDKSAFEKSTSVYFPEKAFHMLPSALSEEVCSLKPNVPRLAFTARIEMDANGKKLKTELFESIIQSKRRGIYEEIQAEWLENKNNPKYELKAAFELYRILQTYRVKRGSIDFELPESFIEVDTNGEPVAIHRRDRVDTHRLIEEFMIAANEAVTEWMDERKGLFIYRIHEFPSAESLLSFQKIAKSVGVSFLIPRAEVTKPFADFIREVQKHPAQILLNSMFLRSLRQARYSTENPGHFGLASEGYTHFTSPIRRYPDLIVHRLLRKMLRQEKQRPELAQKLEEICHHCSFRERIAADAEREARRIKQVRLMMKHVGESFDGVITGASLHGIFVQIQNPFAEGTVPADSLSSQEEFEFDSSRMCMVGRRSKKVLRVGDAVRVQVVRASLQTRVVEMQIEGSQNQNLTTPKPSSKPKGGPQAFLERTQKHKTRRD